MIQYVHSAIDTIQGIKTSFVNNFVTQDAYKAPLLSFVDAQTSFVKAATQSVYDVAVRAGDDLSKLDLAKVFATK